MTQLKQFSIDGFDVISVQRRGEAEMHLNKRYLTFTKSLLEEMGFPAYVRFMVNAKEQMLALKACKNTDENAYKFSLPRDLQKKAKYCQSMPIRKSVFAVLGDNWDESSFYGCRGIYCPDQKAVFFDLSKVFKRNVESFQRKST
jgi:hypothetical protein